MAAFAPTILFSASLTYPAKNTDMAQTPKEINLKYVATLQSLLMCMCFSIFIMNKYVGWLKIGFGLALCNTARGISAEFSANRRANSP